MNQVGIEAQARSAVWLGRVRFGCIESAGLHTPAGPANTFGHGQTHPRHHRDLGRPLREGALQSSLGSLPHRAPPGARSLRRPRLVRLGRPGAGAAHPCPKYQPLIARLHSHEVFTGLPEQVRWDRVDASRRCRPEEAQVPPRGGAAGAAPSRCREGADHLVAQLALRPSGSRDSLPP